MAKTMIVKIQVPLSTNSAEVQALIYNKSRSLLTSFPVTQKLLEWFPPGVFKIYMTAKFSAGNLQLIAKVGDQPW